MWIKIAVQEIGPMMLVAFRALFGLLFGLAVIFIQRVQWPRNVQGLVPAASAWTHEHSHSILPHFLGRTVH